MRKVTYGIAFAAVAALVALSQPAQATVNVDITPPTVNITQPTVNVGSTLSNNGLTPFVPVTWHWTQFDKSGICSEYGYFYHSDSTGSGWVYEPLALGQTSLVVTQQIGGFYEIQLTETDCASNSGTTYGYEYGNLQLVQSNFASLVGPHWTSSNCNCWSGGVVLHTTRKGAFIDEDFTSGGSVSVIGDKAPGRGIVNVYVDGVLKGTFNESSATKQNMVVDFQVLVAAGSHEVEVKNANGLRTDIDAFVFE